MESRNDPAQSPRSGRRTSRNLQTLVSALGLALVLAASLFVASGRLDWPIAWLYIGLRVITGAASMHMMRSRNPELMHERFHPGEGVKAWDRVLAPISTILLYAILIVAALDKRFDWLPELAILAQWAAITVFVAADLFSKWAAVSNPFYSRIVRIQIDRGHSVVAGGPYRFVRHPGYAGALVAGLATAIALGSAWALLPAGLLALLLVVRTALEDRMLQVELPGYTDYAEKTRRRLIPGVW